MRKKEPGQNGPSKSQMLNQDSIHSPLELHAEFDLLCLNLRIPRKMVQCGGSCVHVMLFMSVS